MPSDIPPSPLFLDAGAREHWDNALTRALSAARHRADAGRVTPDLDLDGFRSELAGFDFSIPCDPGRLLSWTIGQMEQGLVHVASPRYFGLFNPGPTTPSQWADRIAAVFNPQLATWTTSPVPVEIEAHTIRSVINRAGLPAHAAGHFTTGGAEANYTALICALTRADAGFGTQGARAFRGAPVFYISCDSHLAWLKIAHQAGIGRSAVRLIGTDGHGQLDVRSLADVIAADRAAGCVPVMVVATAGTTNAGMIDPLHECQQIAAAAGAWFHIDAAWGGGAIASDLLRPVLDGIAQADSVTIDAHKWFATTMGCGMFLTVQPSVLSAVFNVSTSYMPSHEPGRDPYTSTLQWSRRFLGLRLFLSLALFGWDGYARHVERTVTLTARLKEKLAARDWQTANDSRLGVLCLRPPSGPDAVRPAVARVLASGRAWVSATTFEGQDVVRACITHGETTIGDLDTLVSALTDAD